MKVEGNSDYVIKEKLKILKVSLRRWNKKVFGWYDLKVEEGVEEINKVDKLLSSCMDNEVKELVDRRSKAISSIWRNLSIKDNMLIPKSRVKWIQEGNLNSRYFHNLVKGRARRKFIRDVNTVNGVVAMVEDVKKVVRNFFNLKFMEPDPVRPVLEGLPIRTLSHVDVHYLKAPFSDEEIKDAVWCCDGAKSSGPEGYNLFFIKMFLDFEGRYP